MKAKEMPTLKPETRKSILGIIADNSRKSYIANIRQGIDQSMRVTMTHLGVLMKSGEIQKGMNGEYKIVKAV